MNKKQPINQGAEELLEKEKQVAAEISAAEAPKTTTIDDLFKQIESDKAESAQNDHWNKTAPIQEPTTQLSTTPVHPLSAEGVQERSVAPIRNMGAWIDSKVKPYNQAQNERSQRLAIARQSLAGLGDLISGVANLAGTVGGAPNTKLASGTAALGQAVAEEQKQLQYKENMRQKREMAMAEMRNKEIQAQQNLSLQLAKLKAEEAKALRDYDIRLRNAQTAAEKAEAKKAYDAEILRLKDEANKEQKRSNIAREKNASGAHNKKNYVVVHDNNLNKNITYEMSGEQMTKLLPLFNEIFEKKNKGKQVLDPNSKEVLQDPARMIGYIQANLRDYPELTKTFYDITGITPPPMTKEGFMSNLTNKS